MKLCVTATDRNLKATTDVSFGRAPWLLIVDTDTLNFEAIENSGVNASQGAGIAAAQTISDRGAEAVLTGRLGPKAQAALQAASIKMYEGVAHCTVLEAVEQFNQGRYTKASDAAASAAAGAVVGADSGAGTGGGGGQGGAGRGGGGRGGGGRGGGGRGGGGRGGGRGLGRGQGGRGGM